MSNEKRLIDANALAEQVDKSKCDNPHPQGMIRVNHRTEHDHFLRMILDAPTVDAVEVVHGRNIGDEERDEWYRPICQCSICRGYWMMPQDEDAHFCPVCGAKMDGGKKMAKCKDCIHFDACSPHTEPNETYPEVGGCQLFENKAEYIKVVRCKDCKHWHNRTYCTNIKTMDFWLTIRHTKGEDFCSYGERREGE